MKALASGLLPEALSRGTPVPNGSCDHQPLACGSITPVSASNLPWDCLPSRGVCLSSLRKISYFLQFYFMCLGV